MSKKRHERTNDSWEWSSEDEESSSKYQRTDFSEYDVPDAIKQTIVRTMMLIFHKIKDEEEVPPEVDDAIENLATIGFETDAEFEERTRDLTKKQKTDEFCSRGLQYHKRMMFVHEKWRELMDNRNQVKSDGIQIHLILRHWIACHAMKKCQSLPNIRTPTKFRHKVPRPAQLGFIRQTTGDNDGFPT